MGAVGLISLSSSPPLTSASSILQFLVCVCVCKCVCLCVVSALWACAPVVFGSVVPRLWIIHHLKACVCLYHLPGSSQWCVFACICVCVFVTCSLCGQSGIHPGCLSLFVFFSPCYSRLTVSPSCDVVACACVCARPISDSGFHLVCLSLWGGACLVWMEGLGYPSGFATFPAGTTQAPISSTQVRTQLL